jgi:uncharacterized protein YdeI (YjbR/CyaY-like superfamily)
VEPIFFATPEEFRNWLRRNHDSATELLVGYHKRATGRPSLTWPQSVDEALCFGWIDGVRKRIDDERYQIRFTPRKPGSTWSAVNVKRVEELIGLGRMEPAGLAAFERRTDADTGVYSYEYPGMPEFPSDYRARFAEHPQAWEFFEAQPPSYRKTAVRWVMTAKQEATRQKRLAALIQCSAEHRRLPQYSP